MRVALLIAKQCFLELARKKDFYVLILLFVGLSAFFYGQSFSGINDASRYLKDIGYSLIILFSMIIAVTFSAKQLPAEMGSKTIYPLLAKPVSRAELLLGKYLGSLVISSVSFTVFYMLYLIFVMSKGEGAGFTLILQSYALSILLLALISSFSVFFSLFFTIGANITITFLLYFSIYWYNGMLRDALLLSPGEASYLYNILYYILPHFEFYDMRTRFVHLWGPLPLWAFSSIILYTGIYVLAIFNASRIVFGKRNI